MRHDDQLNLILPAGTDPAEYTLPSWESLPDFGLYMEQVITFLRNTLSYLDDGTSPEPVITASAINNHVRKKVIPQPEKKRYYRRHLAYLVILCTLKNSLTIGNIQQILPVDMADDQLKTFYEYYLTVYNRSVDYFIRKLAEAQPENSMDKPDDAPFPDDGDLRFILDSALLASFSSLLSKRLIQSKYQNSPSE